MNIRNIFSVVFLVILLSGCVSEPRLQVMYPKDLVTKQHPYTVYVTITTDTPRVVDEDGLINEDHIFSAFIRAVPAAITKYKLFKEVVDKREKADFHLKIQYRDLKQYLAGGDITARLPTEWQLIKVNGNKRVWRKAFKSTYTEPFEWTGAHVRIGRAIEGVVRKHITKAFQLLSALDL